MSLCSTARVTAHPTRVQVAIAGNQNISPQSIPAHVSAPHTIFAVLTFSNKSQMTESQGVLVSFRDANIIAVCSFESLTQSTVISFKKRGTLSVLPELRLEIYSSKLSRLNPLRASIFSKCARVEFNSSSWGNSRFRSFHS
jgi:hypothetical protein